MYHLDSNDLEFKQLLTNKLGLHNRLLVATISYKNGYTIGGCGFSLISPRVYEGYIYGQGRWINRYLFNRYLSYIFEQYDALVLIVVVNKENIRSLNLMKRFGFYIIEEHPGTYKMQITKNEFKKTLVYFVAGGGSVPGLYRLTVGTISSSTNLINIGYDGSTGNLEPNTFEGHRITRIVQECPPNTSEAGKKTTFKFSIEGISGNVYFGRYDRKNYASVSANSSNSDMLMLFPSDVGRIIDIYIGRTPPNW